MKLPTEIFGEVVVVHTPDEVGEDQADNLVNFLTGQERRNVVVDLDGTEVIDSKGLEALLEAHEQLREEQGELKICTANKANRKILEITRLDQQVEVYSSVIEGVKSFS